MAATSTGHRAAIMRDVELALNKYDREATAPPSFWDYASAVARRMVDLANEVTSEGSIEQALKDAEKAGVHPGRVAEMRESPGNVDEVRAEIRALSPDLSFTAKFTPEAWQRDYAVPVDAEGDTTWDCTVSVLVDRKYFEEQAGTTLEDWSKNDGSEVLDNDDVLKHDPAAPEWVREWSGPFSIHVSPA